MKPRLQSTQSLPVNERSVDVPYENDITTKRLRAQPQHIHSLDGELEYEDYAIPQEFATTNSPRRLNRRKRDQMLDRTEHQIRSLLISSSDETPLKQMSPLFHRHSQEDVIYRPSRSYDVDRVAKNFFEESETLKRFV